MGSAACKQGRFFFSARVDFSGAASSSSSLSCALFPLASHCHGAYHYARETAKRYISMCVLYMLAYIIVSLGLGMDDVSIHDTYIYQ